jgi:hypothetical protein
MQVHLQGSSSPITLTLEDWTDERSETLVTKYQSMLGKIP